MELKDLPNRITLRWAVLSELRDYAVARAAVFPLISEDTANVVFTELHASLLEMTNAAMTLFSVGMYAPVPILLRVAYEALADQLALKRDPNYLYKIQARTIGEGRALPKLLSHGNAERVRLFFEHDGAAPFMRYAKGLEEQLAEAGVSRIEPKDKFTAAGLADEYIFYRFLGMFVHNDNGALIFRHARDPDAAIQPLGLFTTPDVIHLVNWVDIAFTNLRRSCRAIYTDTSKVDELARRYVVILAADKEANPRKSSALDEYAQRAPDDD